jgi:hypothetical protein
MRLGFGALALLYPIAGVAQYSCERVANPPKLPFIQSSGRVKSSSTELKVVQLAGIADTWKDTRREIGSVAAGTVEVLEDAIVVDAPDVVRVTAPIAELNLKEGDTILRFARLGEARADFWAEGC